MRGPEAERIRRGNDLLIHMGIWVHEQGGLFKHLDSKINYIVIADFPPTTLHYFETKDDVINFQKTHKLSSYVYRNPENIPNIF